MLASNEQLKRNPSRLHHSPGYFSLLRLFLFNHTFSKSIPSNEYLEEIEVYDKETEATRERWTQKTKQKREDKKAMKKDLKGRISEIREDIDIATAKSGFLKGGITVNPLNSVLFPVQKRLEKAVTEVRIARSIFLWEETYVAFWIVTFAFVASALALFIPWSFLLRWSLRIAAWVILGPWLALLDRYYLHVDLNDIDLWAKLSQRKVFRITRKAMKKRISKERALKLKAMVKYCFGKFLVSVPRFKTALYWDNPLPESSAVPYDRSAGQCVNIAEKKFGQTLSGDMVMKRDIQVTAESKKALPTKEKRLGRKKTRNEPEKTPNNLQDSKKSPLLRRKNALDEHESAPLPSRKNSQEEPGKESSEVEAEKAPLLHQKPSRDELEKAPLPSHLVDCIKISGENSREEPENAPVPSSPVASTTKSRCHDNSREEFEKASLSSTPETPLPSTPVERTTNGGWMAVGKTRTKLEAFIVNEE
jgi:hypothetical protein